AVEPAAPAFNRRLRRPSTTALCRRPITMIRRTTLTGRQLSTTTLVLALLGTVFLLGQRAIRGTESVAEGSEREAAGKFTEELVYVQSKDGISNCGAIFIPPKNSAKPIAVIWIHGWGVNFYYPSYVKIGRALAERGFACISANTRMHDI